MQELIVNFVEQYGYYAVFILCVIESMCVPLVGEVVLAFTGFLVFQGALDFLPAIMSAFAGSMCGSLLVYFIFRRGGRPLVYRYGHYIRITPHRFDRFSEWFDRFGPLLIVPWRQIPVIRTKISIVAGIFDLSLPVFTALTALGVGIWTVAVVYLSMTFGDNWQQIMLLVKELGNYVYFIILLSVAGVLIIWYWRRKEKRRRRRRRHHTHQSPQGK